MSLLGISSLEMIPVIWWFQDYLVLICLSYLTISLLSMMGVSILAVDLERFVLLWLKMVLIDFRSKKNWTTV